MLAAIQAKIALMIVGFIALGWAVTSPRGTSSFG